MSHLLSLFSALRSGKSKTTPTTIYEDNISEGISILHDDESSTQRPQTLTTNPTYQLSDQPTPHSNLARPAPPSQVPTAFTQLVLTPTKATPPDNNLHWNSVAWHP
jgi:hypothetical protein